MQELDSGYINSHISWTLYSHRGVRAIVCKDTDTLMRYGGPQEEDDVVYGFFEAIYLEVEKDLCDDTIGLINDNLKVQSSSLFTDYVDDMESRDGPDYAFINPVDGLKLWPDPWSDQYMFVYWDHGYESYGQDESALSRDLSDIETAVNLYYSLL